MLHCRLRRIVAANDAWNIFHVLMYWDSVVSFHSATRLSVRLTYVINEFASVLLWSSISYRKYQKSK